MNNRAAAFLVVALIIVSAVIGALAYPRLPEMVASHWNARGEVDGWMPRFWGAFLVPLLAAGMSLLMWVLPGIDPRRANWPHFRDLYNLFVVALNGFLLYVQLLTLAWNLGRPVDIGRAIVARHSSFVVRLSSLVTFHASRITRHVSRDTPHAPRLSRCTR